MEMETAGRIFTGGGNDFYDAGSSGICGGNRCICRPYGVVRGYSKDVPLLWISDQAEFEPQSRRMQADTFLVKPVTEYQLREAVSQLLQKTTRGNEPREEDE